MNSKKHTDYTLSLIKILVGFPLLLSIKLRFPGIASKTLLDLVSSQLHRLWHPYPHTFQPGCVSVPPIHRAFTPSCDFLHIPSSVWNTFPVFFIWKTPTFHLRNCFVLSFTTSYINASYVSGTTLRA